MIDADTASSPIIGRPVATGLHDELTGQAYALMAERAFTPRKRRCNEEVGANDADWPAAREG